MCRVAIHASSTPLIALTISVHLLAQAQSWRSAWDAHNTAGKEAYAQADYAGAIKEFRAAATEAAKDQSKNAKQCLAATLTNLGEVYTETKQYTQAAAALARAGDLWRTFAGPNDVNYAVALRDTAILKQDQKQYVEAERLFRQALSINQKAFGTQHSSTTMVMNDLAILYRQEGK